MDLEQVLDIIIKNFKPYSIFLYGSKATKTDTFHSDYEIGIIFEDEKYTHRQDIIKKIKDTKYALYPFRLSEILHYEIDTPFQKNIYMASLIQGGSITLFGEPVLQKMKPPHIEVTDLLADINFNLGVALSAVRIYKEGNVTLANELLYKSCLFVTRDFVFYKTNKLALSYEEIYEKAIPILSEEYKVLLDTAIAIRRIESKQISPDFYFKNISYINKYILKEIK